MTSGKKKRYRLWGELKRRGVPKVLTMYAATAFIFIEAADIIFPRLGLPDWTVTLLIVLLIIGFPVAFVLSWVFDITPQGVVKTETLEEHESYTEKEKTRRRKLRASDVVIALLLVAVLILAYPKIFGRWDSSLPKEMRGKISIAVMPFRNMTGDSVYNLWQEGMQNLMITSLSNSLELKVRPYETMNRLLSGKSGVNYATLTPSLAGEMARKVEANTVISGNMIKAGQLIRITVNIMNSETEEIYRSFEMEGYAEEDLFGLADTLSYNIRDYLEIKNIKKSQLFDLAQVFTSSSEAYKYFLQGCNYHDRLDYVQAVDYYNKAIEADSNFVSAMMRLAFCYGDQEQAVLSKHWAYKAFEYIDRLPPDMQLMVHTVKAAVDKKPLEQLEYADRYLELHPYSSHMTYMAAWVQYNLEHWQEAIRGFEDNISMMEKLDTKPWPYTYLFLGWALHKTGAHKQEEKIFNEGREIWPGQIPQFAYWQAACAVSRRDQHQADLYLDEIQLNLKQRGWPEAYVWLWFAGVYNKGGSYYKAEEYYRKAIDLRRQDPYIIDEFARFLIESEVNVEEGMEQITPVVAANPDIAAFLYTYALGLYKTGNYKEAEEVLQKSWDLTPYYDHKQFVLMEEVDRILETN
jgi:tetratricopeptide (TPR) repeat protein